MFIKTYQINFSMTLKICTAILCTAAALHANVLSASVADPVSNLLDEAAEYHKMGQEEKALNLYLEVLEKAPRNYEALWNTSLLYTRKGQRQSNFTDEVRYYEKAREFARTCLRYHTDKPRSHYVYGIATAALVDDMPNSSERFRLIGEIKEYADRAVTMDPGYAPAWHLLGVWHSNLANVSQAERFAARLIYGRLPDGASKQKAEEYLNRAIRMEPDEILFYLDLGQHHQEFGEYSKAIPMFEKSLNLPAISENDRHYQQEARDRLRQVGR